MGKQTKGRRRLTLWKFGTKWDKSWGWYHAGCDLVQRYRGPMFPRVAGMGIIERLKKTFGGSKHRAARRQRFNARQGNR